LTRSVGAAPASVGARWQDDGAAIDMRRDQITRCASIAAAR
jgi:hypothetical protein